ncbi:galactose-1-epimerase [Granulicella sp. 5B5]|uniref:aldose epimerase family protein n=1 Tax=Granulicella sp. 5B5 TaxID=1617967 RepID=UPI0015F3A2F6|nr:aldose epimerase family protein [Granulicella sp. 5B5]QMV19783.1 galactose-1-epimerase [Granulicella sp. 5B5]
MPQGKRFPALTHFLAGALILTASAAASHASVTKTAWGTADGQPVSLYTVAGSHITVKFTNFGAHIVSIQAPDRNGHLADVVLGYNSLAGYQADSKTYMGSVVGRYGNRIAKGTFSLDGHTYHIPANDHGNALHGGTVGFDRKVWSAQELPNGVEFTLVSPDGDMGFPGTLTAHVRYTVVGDSIHINYSATTTKPTVVNLTNHTYFSLGGEGHGDILGTVMMINADRYTPVDSTLIPTGKLDPVAGTPMDFRTPTAIGKRINDNFEQLKLAGGYDHNWVLNAGQGTGLHLAAKAVDPTSGRTLTVTTTQPGVQFYSGNFLDGSFTGAGGAKYQKHFGFCLETQHFPDSPNHPAFPTTELKPGETMHSETVFTFGIEK